MRRPIFAGVVMTLQLLLCGSPAERVLCQHVDGTKAVEAGKHDCCAPAAGGRTNVRASTQGAESDACPGCTDTLLPADSALRQVPGSKTFTASASTPAILTSAAAPAARSIPSFVPARSLGRHPALSRSIPLLI